MKENYENVKMLLSALWYDQYNWEVIGDFKMVAFLMGLQQPFTKFPCYLSLWDSRNTNFHYNKRNWQACPWEWDSHGIPMGIIPWDGMGWDSTHLYLPWESSHVIAT